MHGRKELNAAATKGENYKQCTPKFQKNGQEFLLADII